MTVEVRAAGVNRADVNSVSGRRNPDPRRLPVLPGFEIAGVVSVVGPPAGGTPHTLLPGDEVVACRVTGGFATHVIIQQAPQIGAAVIGTTGSARAAQAERFGAIRVLYGTCVGPGVRSLARPDVEVALGAAGSAEALSVSLDLVRRRVHDGKIALHP